MVKGEKGGRGGNPAWHVISIALQTVNRAMDANLWRHGRVPPAAATSGPLSGHRGADPPDADDETAMPDREENGDTDAVWRSARAMGLHGTVTVLEAVKGRALPRAPQAVASP